MGRVWVGYGWGVGRVWVRCGWGVWGCGRGVGGVWVGYGWGVGRVWVRCGWGVWGCGWDLGGVWVVCVGVWARLDRRACVDWSVCLSVCLSACLSVCLVSVCLLQSTSAHMKHIALIDISVGVGLCRVRLQLLFTSATKPNNSRELIDFRKTHIHTQTNTHTRKENSTLLSLINTNGAWFVRLILSVKAQGRTQGGSGGPGPINHPKNSACFCSTGAKCPHWGQS